MAVATRMPCLSDSPVSLPHKSTTATPVRASGTPPMEAAQESELHGRQAWWPLDTMACSLDSTTSSSSCVHFEWERQLSWYFGLGSLGVDPGGPDTHERELELFVPKCMDSPVSEASTAVTGLPTAQNAMAMPGELDELLQNLWGSDEEPAVGLSSFCALKEASAFSSQHAAHLSVSSISLTSPTSPEKTLTQPQAELPSSSSSHCSVDPQASDTSATQRQIVPANCSSSKRPAPEGTEVQAQLDTECGESRKRSRKAPSSTVGAGTVAHPFTVVKPSGVDGGVTLADINEWILTPPAHPVRHPVGEFACAPWVPSGNRPAPSGRTVAGFTRLHTAGRGTITIVRTRG
ncbi:uncharacterized protein LOC133895148 [Phragmites australis]|uniref:uncharacterized protein LOC133895148 n=1 Tax=Phragmites australis TaxID=29695 RepID=UPI002D77C712|nr:uncharacterized protein LOC133895148 [Phragmites australis]